MPSVNPLEKKEENRTGEIISRRQKTAVIFLAFFGLLIIVLWAFQFHAQISDPFKVDKQKASSTSAVASSTDTHLLDTDGDGLSDYDEINIYHTSPYLEDSDSDGIPDKQEILQGTDPNCPTGKDCSASEASTTPVISSSTIDTSIGSGLLDDTTQSSDTGASDTGAAATSTTVTPAILRQILLQNGWSQADLDKISDEDIMKSYQEANLNASGTSAVSQ